MAGQRAEQDHGLRGGSEAGYEVYHGVEYGAGSADFGEDFGCGFWAGWGDVSSGGYRLWLESSL